MSRQPLFVPAGLIQPSRVIAEVRCSEAESGTLTRELEPSKASALPYFPFTQLVLAAVPFWLLPYASATADPVPSSNAYAATGVGADDDGVVAVAVLE